MKKLAIAVVTLFTSLFTTNTFAQGTINFSIRSTLGTAHIYGAAHLPVYGQGSNDSPSGSTDYSGFTPIGTTFGGLFGASTTFAQLLGANGANAPESSLTPQGSVATFRTGAAAGALAALPTDTLQGITPDSPVATLELVVWDNESGLYSTWTQASVAWLSGIIQAGKSGAFNVSNIGGSVNDPPEGLPIGPGELVSFSIGVPEPSTFALLSLGAALLLPRRRK